jgi:hypothetical protein
MLTLEVSRKFCCSVPKPIAPGLPVVGEPEASVSSSRLSPLASRPGSLMKLASWNWPSRDGAVWPAMVAST